MIKKLMYLMLILPSLAFADSKVSDLTEQTSPKTTDYMYLVANSTSMKVQLGSVLNLTGSATTFMTISSQTASNLVNQGQYVFLSSQAASNVVNQGQYLFRSSAAASNLVNQGQYLFSSIAATTYQPLNANLTDLADGSLTGALIGSGVPAANIAPGDLQSLVLASSVAAGSFQAAISAGSNVTVTPTSDGVSISATGGGGGSGTTISVEDGGSAIVATSTIGFTGAEFIVTNSGGEALVKLDQSSVTMLGANPAVAGDVSGTIGAVVVTDDSHAHTGTTISGVDISGDTNLAVTAPVVLTGDTLSLSAEVVTHSSASVTYTHLSTVAATYLTIASQTASNVVNQGQYLFKSSAAATYAPIVGSFVQSYRLDGSSVTKGGVLVAGSNITLTPGSGITTIAATGGGGVDYSTISVSYTHLSTGPKFSEIIIPQSVKLSSDTCVIQNSTNNLTSLLLCDGSNEEYVFFPTFLNNYRGGGFVLDLHYSAVSATSGNFTAFGEIMCVSPGDSADLDTPSFATRVSVSDTIPATAGYMGDMSISLTDDSCAKGDELILKFGRSGEAASDTVNGTDIEIRPSVIYEP